MEAYGGKGGEWAWLSGCCGPCGRAEREPFGHTSRLSRRRRGSALDLPLCGGYLQVLFRVLLSKRGEPLAVWGWFGSVLNPVDFIHRFVAPTTCSLLLVLYYLSCVFGLVQKSGGDVFGLVQIYPLCVFGLVLENSLESHKPVENQQFTSSDDPGRRGYLEPNPARKGR